MKNEQDVLDGFIKWADGNSVVRAAVLTSSRANPHRTPDALSDYDIELYVSDLKGFKLNDDWASYFGSIMMCWPLTPSVSSFEQGCLTRLIIFENGLRIDFQITENLNIPKNIYRNGYSVLIDKDGLTANLAAPDYAEYNVSKPSKDEFELIVNEFWWEADYVAKYLWRDEFPASHVMFARIHHEYLYKVIEWYIGLQNDWSVNTGIDGKWFKKFLDKDTWQDFESCFSGAAIEENWKAFFSTIELFRKLSKVVAEGLSYEYPVIRDSKATERFKEIHIMKRAS